MKATQVFSRTEFPHSKKEWKNLVIGRKRKQSDFSLIFYIVI